MTTEPSEAHAAAFAATHGYPCPLKPEDFLPGQPLAGVPFCEECSDWHFPEDEHSDVPQVYCCEWVNRPQPGRTTRCSVCKTVFTCT